LKKTVITIIFILAVCNVFAGYGGEPYAFLTLGASTRATGMGSAFTAIADDASAAFYNPGGLTQLTSLQVMAESYFLTFGRNMNFISVANPFLIENHLYSYGISWINYSAGSDIEARTTNSPNPDSTFSDYTNIFNGSMALQLSKTFGLGVNLKYLSHTINKADSNGFSFDIGMLAKVEAIPGMKIGASFENLGSLIGWSGSSASETMPPTIDAGVSYGMKNILNIDNTELTGDCDFLYNTFGPATFAAGIEAKINTFFIRAGYNNGLTLGAGVCFIPSKIFDIKADYAFTMDTILPDSINNRIGITLDFISGQAQGNGDETQPAQSQQNQEQKTLQIKDYRLDDDW